MLVIAHLLFASLAPSLQQEAPFTIGETLRLSDTGEQYEHAFKSLEDVSTYFKYYWATYGDGETDQAILKQRKQDELKYGPLVAKAKKSKSIIPLKLNQRLTFLATEALVDPSGDAAIYYKVKLKNGPDAGQIYLVSNLLVGSLDLEAGEACTLTGGRSGFLSAFEPVNLEEARKAVKIGDERVVNGLIALDRVQINKNGTTAAFHSSSSEYKRVRIQSGQHKGKLVWVDSYFVKLTPPDPYENWKPSKRKG